jgi:small subunit ribosomal protein S1
MSEAEPIAPTAAPETPAAVEPAAPPEPKQLRIHGMMANRKKRFDKPKKPPEENIAPTTREKPKLRDLDSEIEAELAAAMEGLGDQDLLGGDLPERKPGEKKITLSPVREGTVVSVHGSDVFVQVPGGRSQGMLPMEQFPEGPPKVGDKVLVQVERFDHDDGILVFTRQGAVQHANWDTVAIGQIVEARCTEVNRGGLAVEVNNIRGFLPISQIDMFRVENAEQFVNQKLRCMVVEVDPAAKNLVVSRRALLEHEREEMAKKVWEELTEGQTRQGMIRLIKPFGAFVDIGGADGLIPISEMSWSRIKDPSEVVKVGEMVEVVVTRVDREARKVTLSLRQMKPSPWDTIHINYPEGTLVEGTVARIEPFGAFVEIEPGIEGLVHISEVAGQRVRHPGDVLKVGEKVQVKVVNIDRDQRRIGLSIKAIKEAEREAEERAAALAAGETPPEPPKPRVKNPNLRGGMGTAGPLFPSLGGK